MSSANKSRNTWLALLFVAALATPGAYAAEAAQDADADAEAEAEEGENSNLFNYEVSGGFTYSDNIGQTKTNKVWETGLETGLRGNLAYEHRRVKAMLGSDLLFRTHGKLGYNDELMGGIAGRLDYLLVNDRVNWVVEDNLGQSLINRQNQGTIDNLQNVNFFSTGPEISLPFGPRTSITLSGRWSDVAYFKSSGDTRGLEGTVGLRRQLGMHTQVSLNARTEHITYKSLPSSLDYDINSAYFGWNAVGAKTTLALTAGYTQLKEQLDTTGGALFGVTLGRKLSSRTRLQFNAGREFDNSADTLRRGQTIGGVFAGGENTNVAADPFRSDYGNVAWIFDGGRSGFQLDADWRREAHTRLLALDMESRGGGMQVTRQITPRMQLSFNARYRQEDFQNTNVNFDEWSTGLQLGWNLTEAISLTGSLTHRVGSGDTLFGPNSRDFTENRLVVAVHWAPRRPPAGSASN